MAKVKIVNTDPERRQADADMMEDLRSWPCWPWLPLKHRERRTDGMPELALMHADHVLSIDGLPRVYHIALHERGGYFPSPEHKFTEYDSVEAVVADGWRID